MCGLACILEPWANTNIHATSDRDVKGLTPTGYQVFPRRTAKRTLPTSKWFIAAFTGEMDRFPDIAIRLSRKKSPVAQKPCEGPDVSFTVFPGLFLAFFSAAPGKCSSRATSVWLGLSQQAARTDAHPWRHTWVHATAWQPHAPKRWTWNKLNS